MGGAEALVQPQVAGIVQVARPWRCSRRSPRSERSQQREQARNLIATAYETGAHYAALYVLALHTGMREGELLGLKWEDVDLVPPHRRCT
jgi:integrase